MQSGTMLVHYRVEELIGKGGMGEVYRARDTKLSRDVALKILPPEFAEDGDRLARFEREAKVLASLHHPNIASIFGFEHGEECTFLVMELVDGEDLAEILRQGPLSVDDAVDIARQIAEGLEEAHEKGVVHRDLKPANVKRSSDGKVKVLDFGLARAFSGQTATEEDVSSAPTMTAAMTQVGTVLGTAAYMSPEQARGKEVDRRADIWAFGVVLFEMLSGRQVFAGETASDTLAGILKSDPEWDRLPDDLPFQVERVLRRCLAKDPRQRLRDIGEARVRLDDPDSESMMFSGPMAAVKDSGWNPGRLLPWVLLSVALIVGAVGWFSRPSAPKREARQYELQLLKGESIAYSYRPVVSPDGRWVAAALPDTLGELSLHLRSLETGDQEQVANTRSSEFPFWSPDSKYLGFFQEGYLRKLHVESGSVQVVSTEVRGLARGGAWSGAGQILFAPGANDGLLLVDSENGPTRPVTAVDSTMADGSHRWPVFLPDGRRFLFTVWSNVLDERAEKGGIFLADLNGGEPRRILRDVSAVVYVHPDHLLFHRNGRLMAVAFDPQTGQVQGDPVLVSKSVGFQSSNGLVSASANERGDIFVGTHVPENRVELAWVGRDGQVQGVTSGDLPLAFGLDLAPDGRHYAVGRLDDVGSVEIWIGDTERGSMARLSRFENDCFGASFSPDGREVIYGVQTLIGSALYRHDISGALDPVLVLELNTADVDATGRHWFAADRILVDIIDSATKDWGIHVLDIGTGVLTPVLVNDFDQQSPRMSPDGNWLAYQSSESGIPEVYVRNWPQLDRKWQVSRDGGVVPHWSDDGAELMFVSARRREVMAVDFVVENGEPRISLPLQAMSLPQSVDTFAYGGDHQRFLAGLGSRLASVPPIKVLVR